jgi:hypothetical protein
VRSADTTPEAHSRQIDTYRSMSPDRRVSVAVAMSEDVFAIVEEGIRARHPDYDERRVRWAALRLRVGDVTFRQAWPDAPLVAP